MYFDLGDSGPFSSFSLILTLPLLRNHSPDGATRTRYRTTIIAHYSFIDLERMKG